MSAYEEAIFRVYDRTLEGVSSEELDHDDGNISRKTCQTLEMVLLGGTAVVTLFTVVLHCAFVGQPGCLPDLLHQRMIQDNRSSLLPDDAILQINVDKRYYDGNDPFNPNGDVFDHEDDDITMGDRRSRRRLLREEESDTLTKFRKQMRHYESSRTDNNDKFGQYFRGRKPMILQIAAFFAKEVWTSGLETNEDSGKLGRQTAPATFVSRLLGGNTTLDAKSKTHNATGSNTTDPYQGFDPRYFQRFDFEYSADVGVLSLSNKIRAKHNFTLVNVTMAGEQCYGNGFTQSLIAFGSVDNLVLNNLMFTLNKKGMMVSSRNDYYMWHQEALNPYFNAGTWLGFKVTVALKTFFSYFLLSSSTALLVRVLISSGVALIFPIFSLMHYTGVMGATDQHLRLVSHAYPWLGIPMEMMAGRGASQVPFVMAHISRVILFYTLYEALQFAISIWFYDDNQPGQKELWLFALMMIWEYYSMVYVRTYSSIVLFPRATAAAFALYHIYLYSFPGGYHYLVLFIMFLLTVWLMLYCIRKYEHESYQRGVVNADQPRQLYNHLPYPVWSQDLAPDFSLFLPPQFRSTSIYADPPAGYGQSDASNDADTDSGGGGGRANRGGGGSGSGSGGGSGGDGSSMEGGGSGGHGQDDESRSVEMGSAGGWSSYLGLGSNENTNRRDSAYEQLDVSSSHRSRDGGVS